MKRDNFQETGFSNFGRILDSKKCKELKNRIAKLRKLDKSSTLDLGREGEEKTIMFEE